ncbi:MAG: NAD(P)-dependent oxidoreductase, partial [Gammaproteobacteria bacterium]|nr:NAD(P)-dependent oxidoreductase [Gammaproteobacteria bacterium]NIX86421.1 NAD(P)-dependent oxidoreductase [Gammaproteobacteria bacterium]
VCVVDDADVEAVVLNDNLLAGMAPGGIIAVHSTVHPDTCRRLANEAESRGVKLLDAPVSGGADAARAGTLAVMVGGDPTAFEAARGVFES